MVYYSLCFHLSLSLSSFLNPLHAIQYFSTLLSSILPSIHFFYHFHNLYPQFTCSLFSHLSCHLFIPFSFLILHPDIHPLFFLFLNFCPPIASFFSIFFPSCHLFILFYLFIFHPILTSFSPTCLSSIHNFLLFSYSPSCHLLILFTFLSHIHHPPFTSFFLLS